MRYPEPDKTSKRVKKVKREMHLCTRVKFIQVHYNTLVIIYITKEVPVCSLTSLGPSAVKLSNHKNHNLVKLRKIIKTTRNCTSDGRTQNWYWKGTDLCETKCVRTR